MKIEEMKAIAIERLNAYLQHIETPVLEYCNYIVQVGAMTVAEKGNKYVAVNTYFPEQFSEDTAKVISQIKWFNGDGNPIEAKPVKAIDWYNEQISFLKETIKILEN